MICCLSFVVCACVSFWFRRDIASLEDRAFFFEREAHFRMKLNPANDDATIVHIQSSVNFHKLIVFSGARSIPEGTLSLSAVDALGPELMGLRGCQIDAKSLKHGFFVLRAYC
jgi:hypothetical protein